MERAAAKTGAGIPGRFSRHAADPAGGGGRQRAGLARVRGEDAGARGADGLSPGAADRDDGALPGAAAFAGGIPRTWDSGRGAADQRADPPRGAEPADGTAPHAGADQICD